MTVVLRVGGGVEDPAGVWADGLPADLAEWAVVSRALEGVHGEARTVVRRRAEQLAARHALAARLELAVLDGDEVRLFRPPEPTPWATGLTVSAFVAAVVAVALAAMSSGLATLSPLLAVGANLLVMGGLLPSLLLLRALPVWRWGVLGVLVGAAVAWVGLALATLS